MTNPNPGLITNEMWNLWEEAERIIPGVKLSGIYADKKAYHNTVNNNKRLWPGNYSIKLSLDLKGPFDKARAIDLTMSDSEMVKWTKRMKASAEDPADNRLAAVREFYGTLDNKTVFGLIKNDENGSWRRSSSDLSHLWHGHMSLFTFFVNNWAMLAPILSVWSGETYEEWLNNMFPIKGDESEEVRFWQFTHNLVRNSVTPPSPLLTVDNNYGDLTVAAFTDFAKKSGAASNYVANRMTAWLATKYNVALVKSYVPKEAVPVPVPPSDEKLKQLVNEWLTANVPSSLTFLGDVTGRITLS